MREREREKKSEWVTVCVCVLGHARIHLKSIVNIICIVPNVEMLNSQKVNPNSLLAEA